MKKRRFKVTFFLRQHNHNSVLAGIFDMLRYDNATVETWNHSADGPTGEQWELVIQSERFTPDRWASFGLYPKETL